MEKTNSLAYFPDQGGSRDRVLAGEFIVLNDRACPAVQQPYLFSVIYFFINNYNFLVKIIEKSKNSYFSRI